MLVSPGLMVLALDEKLTVCGSRSLAVKLAELSAISRRFRHFFTSHFIA